MVKLIKKKKSRGQKVLHLNIRVDHSSFFFKNGNSKRDYLDYLRKWFMTFPTGSARYIFFGILYMQPLYLICYIAYIKYIKMRKYQQRAGQKQFVLPIYNDAIMAAIYKYLIIQSIQFKTRGFHIILVIKFPDFQRRCFFFPFLFCSKNILFLSSRSPYYMAATYQSRVL